MTTLSELASSQDELFMQLADALVKLEAIELRLERRDATNLLMVKHVERLVREKEQLLQFIGLQTLQQSTRPARQLSTNGTNLHKQENAR